MLNNTRLKNLFLLVGAVAFFTQTVGCSGTGAGNSRPVANQTNAGVMHTSPQGHWRPTQKNSIPVVMNDRVRKWVELFNGSLQPSFNRWMGRIGRYGLTIEKVLDEEGVPRDLIYLAMIESGFNLSAYSSAAASGPWQFISSTGRMYGLEASTLYDQRRDLIYSTRAAARHLKDLYKIYGDWYLAFAAYNAGAGKVNSAIKRGGNTDYWVLSSPRSSLLRQETKDYVPKILAALHIVKNYSKYGYNDKSFSSPIQYDRVTVADAADVKTIANCALTNEETIRELNPALVAGVTRPTNKTAIYIPKGTRDEFNRRYQSIPESKRVSNLQYRVGYRETIASIANKFGTTTTKIEELNSLPKNGQLSSGQIVNVPASKPVLLAMANGQLFSGADTREQVVYHKVRAGESLPTVAKKYGVSADKIAKWNELKKNNKLQAGQRLRIVKNESKKHRSEGGVFVAGKSSVPHMSGVANIIANNVSSDNVKDEKKEEKLEYIETASSNSLATVSAPSVVDSDSTLGQIDSDAPFIVKTNEEDALLVGSAPVADVDQTNTGAPNVVTAVATQTLEGTSTGSNLQTIGEEPDADIDNSIAALTQQTSPVVRTITHTVKSGETISRIASIYKVKAEEIVDWNKFKGKATALRIGQKLLIQQKVVASAAPAAVDNPTVTPTISKTSEGTVNAGSNPTFHVVRSGETLSRIAGLYRVALIDLKKWNRLATERVYVGQKLRLIPEKSGPALSTNATSIPSQGGANLVQAQNFSVTPKTVIADSNLAKKKVIFYKVRPGETLWVVAKKHQVSVTDLKKWNNLKSDQIKSNQTIKIIAS